MTYRTLTPKSKLHAEIEAAGMDTMEKVFAFAVANNRDKRCLGTRSVLNEVEVEDPQTGKLMKKYELGDYNWKTYAQVDEIAANLASGFASIGIQPKAKVAIFAETRMEWLITAMAAFKRNLQSKSFQCPNFVSSLPLHTFHVGGSGAHYFHYFRVNTC